MPSPAEKCALCGRKLNDETSKARGVGSECWRHFVFLVESDPRYAKSVMRLHLGGE